MNLITRCVLPRLFIKRLFGGVSPLFISLGQAWLTYASSTHTHTTRVGDAAQLISDHTLDKILHILASHVDLGIPCMLQCLLRPHPAHCPVPWLHTHTTRLPAAAVLLRPLRVHVPAIRQGACRRRCAGHCRWTGPGNIHPSRRRAHIEDWRRGEQHTAPQPACPPLCLCLRPPISRQPTAASPSTPRLPVRPARA